jgi:hypothetical protein
MRRNQGKVSVINIVILLLAFINAIVLQQGLVSHPKWYLLLYITIPLLLISILVSRKY